MDDNQMEIYKFIIAFIKENGYPPTYREIGKAVHRAASMIIPDMWALECNGWIKTKRNCPRAIKVIGYDFVKQE